jgi:hypothetical protein
LSVGAFLTTGPQSTLRSSSSGSGKRSFAGFDSTRFSSGGIETRYVALTTLATAVESRLNAVTRIHPPLGKTRSTWPSACPQPPVATSKTGTVKVRWKG